MRTPWVIAALALALPLGGCLTPAKGTAPDQFLITSQAQVSEAQTLPLTLGIRDIEAGRPYQLAMAHTDAEGRLNYYQTATWAEFPASAVTRALRDGILKTHRFSDAGMAEQMARPDLMLVGYLNAFHEDRSAAPPQAVVEVRLELRKARSTELYWAGTLREVEPITGAGPSGLASAMNAAVQRLVTAAAQQIAAVEIAP